MPEISDHTPLETADDVKPTKAHDEKSALGSDGADMRGGVSETASEEQVQRVAVDTKPKPKKPLAFHLSFVCLSLLVLIVSWDAIVLSVAIPIIAEQLHGTTLESFWASIAYMLGVAVTQPLFASISDVLGRKGPLYFSIVLFGVGSIVFAVAEDMTTLIAGRAIQGLGGGGLDVLQEMIVVDMTTLKERPLYLALMAIPTATGSIVGPVVGALLSEYASWRWIGWINLPVLGVASVLAFMFLRLRPIGSSFASKMRALDWVGMFLFTAATVSVSLPLSWADSLYSWGSWRTILPLILGVFIFVGFGWYEARPAQPMIPYRLVNNRTAAMALIAGTLHGAVLYAVLLYFPLFFQIFTTNLIPMQASIKHVDDAGLAAGLTVIFRIFGGLIGLAVGSSAFNSVFSTRIASLRPLPAEVSVLSDPRQAIGFIPTLRLLDLPPATMNNIIDAYRISFRAIWIVLACLAGVGLVSSLLLEELDLENEEMGKQRFEESKTKATSDSAPEITA
ncbi:hypothetical protein SLS64_002450 [Diaporthe eres]|uniref:Major facilitator superfamily (MFS) profile domain-containing protein n=1 Tax=Diaporthe eres TaxID=83184 RepID=A0ABR1NLU7_DIAER